MASRQRFHYRHAGYRTMVVEDVELGFSIAAVARAVPSPLSFAENPCFSSSVVTALHPWLTESITG